MCNRTDCAGSWAGELACAVCGEGEIMKRSDFELLYGYHDQAPRCYLCLHYCALGNEKYACREQELDQPMRVKPNGICKKYTPGPYAKNKDATK